MFADLPTYLIGLDCGLAELERRERERGDRQVGRAVLQHPLVHAHGLYDVRVATDTPSLECALAMRTRLETPEPPTAFADLRRVYPLAR